MMISASLLFAGAEVGPCKHPPPPPGGICDPPVTNLPLFPGIENIGRVFIGTIIMIFAVSTCFICCRWRKSQKENKKTSYKIRQGVTFSPLQIATLGIAMMTPCQACPRQQNAQDSDTTIITLVYAVGSVGVCHTIV